MSDGNYLAADRMPEELKHWESVEVYCRSWASEMKAGHWQRCLVEHLKPWHVWRYAAPLPRTLLMDRAAEVREQLGVEALEGNGYYVAATAKGGGS